MDLFLTDKGDVFVIGDITATHGTEMGRFKLTVNHEAPEDIEHPGQMDKGQFRGAGNQRKHAFTKETPTQVDPIKATYESIAILVFLPHLYTRRKTLAMEFGIGLDDVRTEPGPILDVAVLGSGASVDNALKILVEGANITILVNELLHRMADMNLLRKDNETLQGTIPIRLIAMTEREPGEETIRISQQQTIDGEVATHSHQSVVLAQMRIREPQSVV